MARFNRGPRLQQDGIRYSRRGRKPRQKIGKLRLRPVINAIMNARKAVSKLRASSTTCPCTKPGTSKNRAASKKGSAGFQTCCIADFQIGSASELLPKQV